MPLLVRNPNIGNECHYWRQPFLRQREQNRRTQTYDHGMPKSRVRIFRGRGNRPPPIYIYIYIYIYTFIYTYTHIHIHVHINAYIWYNRGRAVWWNWGKTTRGWYSHVENQEHNVACPKTLPKNLKQSKCGGGVQACRLIWKPNLPIISFLWIPPKQDNSGNSPASVRISVCISGG